MKNSRTYWLQISCALALFVLGNLSLLQWSSGLQLPWLSFLAYTSATTPLLMILTAVALFEHPAWRRVGMAAAVLVLIGASLSIVEIVFNIDAGLSVMRMPQMPMAPTASTPNPGRLAPNTGLAFLLVAACLLLTRRHRAKRVRRVLAAGVALIGGGALLGYLLDLDVLFRVASYNSMLAPSAVAVTLAGVAVCAENWPGRRRLPSTGEASTDQIFGRIGAVLLAVAVATGTVAFVIVKDGFQKAVLENILLTTTTNAGSLATTIEGRLWFPRTLVTRPLIWDAYRDAARAPQNPAWAATFDKVGRSFLSAGIGYIRFTDSSGKVLGVSGKPIVREPKAALRLADPRQRAVLLWQDGFVLRVENDVVVDGAKAGSVLTEERIGAFEKLVLDIQKSGPTSDMLICAREADTAVCAPSRLYKKSEHIPMYRPDGRVNLPINRALLGETGTLRTSDIRGVPVFAGFAPIGSFGLGIVVKLDEASVYAPLRERFFQLIALVCAAFVLGWLAIRFQVRPLLVSLIRAQTRNKVILANSNDAFIALDADGKITDWNRQAERTLGWSEHEAIGSDLAEMIIPPEQRAAHVEGLKRFSASGDGPVINRQIEVSAMRRDGSIFQAELAVTGYRDGERYVSNAFLRDITARKLAEKLLADSERFLRTVADSLPALVGYVDTEQRYLFANSAYQWMANIDPETMIGRTIRDVLGEETYVDIAPFIARALTGERVHFETDGRVPGRPAHYMTDYIPNFGDEGEVLGFFITVIDISKRKQAEMRADAASRAKSEFLANMSHEIRTPMNAVLGLSQLLSTTPLSADQLKYLSMIQSSGKSLLGILNDILDFSKIEAGRLAISQTPFALSEVLNNAAAIMSVGAGERELELAISVEPEVPRSLVGDGMRLQQILTNIVGNAIKFTERGEVSLHVELAAQVGQQSLLRFVVRDTGIGMSEAEQSTLFSAFSQADASTTRRFGGTGLGLAISRRLAQMMGGDISVRSEPGAGSTFILELPMTASATPRETGEKKKLRLLIVDDNATSRDALCKTARSWNWEAQAAASGAEALAAIEAQPHFDVVLTDLNMPGMNGLETARAIRARAQATPTPLVVMLSAFARKQHAGAIETDDVDAVVLKPVTSSSLYDGVHQALARRSGGQQAVALHTDRPSTDALKGLRVLLVEDNEVNQFVAKGVLHREGAIVDVADNGVDALDKLRAPTPYDVVLMDVQMPVMDGLAAAREARRLGLSVPIIAMTAGVMPEERQACLDSGMNGFVAKPIDIDDMVATILRHAAPMRAVPSVAPAQRDGDGVLNIDQLVAMSKRASGHQTKLVPMLERIEARANAEMLAASVAFYEGRLADSGKLLHGLRGSVGALGARRFVAACHDLEQALRVEAPDASDLFEQVREELAQTMAALERALEELRR